MTKLMSEDKSSKRDGILLCFLLGCLAIAVGKGLPLLGSATSAILLGIILGNIKSPGERFAPGIKWCEKTALEIAVVGMGFQLSTDLGRFGRLAGGTILTAIISTLVATALLNLFLKKYKERNMLIGVGTAICGTSAIAAMAPLIKHDQRDVGLSVGVINLLGIVGIFAVPLIAQFLDFNPQQTAAFIGGSLQAVGHVAAAAFSQSDEIAQLALPIKMGRVAMLLPLLILLSIKKRAASDTDRKDPTTIKTPWYLWGFLLTALVKISGIVPIQTLEGLLLLDKAFLTLAMVAIGLNIQLAQMRAHLSKTLAVAVSIWIVQLTSLAIVISYL